MHNNSNLKMTNLDKIIFVFLLISIPNCFCLEKGCRMSQLDSKMKPLTRLVKDVTWPQNENEMDQMCKTLPRQLRDARNFTKKCAKGESKTILSVSIHAVEKINVKTNCKNKNERRKVISSAKCANAGREASVKCWTHNINSMTAISNLTESKDKIPLLCCSLLRWKDCFIKVYEAIGSPICSTDSIEYFDQYLYKSTIDPMNIFCTEYEDSDKCNKFDQFFAKSVTKQAKFGTPFPAILELFESL